jgi:hypothetical protein
VEILSGELEILYLRKSCIALHPLLIFRAEIIWIGMIDYCLHNTMCWLVNVQQQIIQDNNNHIKMRKEWGNKYILK